MNAGEFPAGVVEIGLPGGTSDVGDLMTLFHERGFGDVMKKPMALRGLYG
ncbi:hypothetical protein P4S72_22430 [Vibrio sp. PP-XX7]